MITLELNKTYSYTTKYPSVLGGKFKDMELEALNISSNLAVKYDDIYVMHNSIKAIAEESDSIKTLSVNNLNWLIFRNTTNNNYIVIAEEYIDMESIASSGGTFSFKVSNITTLDIAVIKKALSELGYYTEE